MVDVVELLLQVAEQCASVVGGKWSLLLLLGGISLSRQENKRH